jgi:hypothetical protein
MTTASIVAYMHELKEAGFTDRQAEVQATKIEQVTQTIYEKTKQDAREKEKDLATKGDLYAVKSDLYTALKDQELRLIKWMIGTVIGTGATVIIAIAGLIKYIH